VNGIALSLTLSSLYTPSVANAPVVQNQILYDVIMVSLGASLVAQMVKSLPAVWETGVQSLGWKDPPWKRKWQPTPVFLPGKSHGWKSLVGYSPHGPKELDTTEKLQLFSFYGIFKKTSFLPPFYSSVHLFLWRETIYLPRTAPVPTNWGHEGEGARDGGRRDGWQIPKGSSLNATSQNSFRYNSCSHHFQPG